MKVTQCDKVLRHLKDHGSITSLTASGKNRYGETTHYSVYRLDNKVKEN